MTEHNSQDIDIRYSGQGRGQRMELFKLQKKKSVHYKLNLVGVAALLRIISCSF